MISLKENFLFFLIFPFQVPSGPKRTDTQAREESAWVSPQASCQQDVPPPGGGPVSQHRPAAGPGQARLPWLLVFADLGRKPTKQKPQMCVFLIVSMFQSITICSS